MKLPDVNLLLYTINTESQHHARAKQWLASAFDDPQGVAFSWLVLVGFLRLSTQAKMMPVALQVGDALSLLDDWLVHPRAQVLHPTQRHAGILARLLLSAGTAGNLTNDAHLAALAIEHNATIGTFDKDFNRFAGVKIDLLKTRPI